MKNLSIDIDDKETQLTISTVSTDDGLKKDLVTIRPNRIATHSNTIQGVIINVDGEAGYLPVAGVHILEHFLSKWTSGIIDILVAEIEKQKEENAKLKTAYNQSKAEYRDLSVKYSVLEGRLHRQSLDSDKLYEDDAAVVVNLIDHLVKARDERW